MTEKWERWKKAHEDELRVVRDFQRRESERADRNGEYASKMEVALMDARHTLETMTAGLEEVARRHGWSEEVNCSPWTWLDNEIARLREPMTVEQLMSIAAAAKEDVLVVAGHVFTDRYLSAARSCLRCGRTAMSNAVLFYEVCDGPALTTEQLIAALHGEEGKSSDE